MADKIALIPPIEIVADERWNSRGVEKVQSDADRLSDEELEASIREKGLLQPVRVRMVAGVAHLNFGFRRWKTCLKIAPTVPIQCSVMPSTGDEIADDLRARFENLTENIQRRDISTFRLADSVWQMKRSHPALSCAEIAKKLGKSADYVDRLHRLRSSLCKDLIESWRDYPDRFPVNALLSVVTVSKDEQVAAYNARFEAKKGGRPKGARTQRSVRIPDVDEWQEEVSAALASRKSSGDPVELAFLRGVRHTIAAVKGGDFDLDGAMRKAARK